MVVHLMWAWPKLGSCHGVDRMWAPVAPTVSHLYLGCDLRIGGPDVHSFLWSILLGGGLIENESSEDGGPVRH